MKVLVAGATGAVGSRLVPMLLRADHEVVAMSRSQARAEPLRALGARIAIVDGLDRYAVIELVTGARPDVIVHQMTALAGLGSSLRRFDRDFAVTNQLRTRGTENLLAGARQAGVGRLVAQSYTGWPNVRAGGPVKSERDELDPVPPRTQRESLRAIRELERLATTTPGIEGIALRYGSLYGPGTGLERGGPLLDLVVRRRFPIVGGGAGLWSFIHVDDAAAVTAAALDQGRTGVFNIVDDEPAPVSVWLPYLAHAIGAKPPRRIPAWLGRLVAGEVGVAMMTEIRGSANAKARAELGFSPRYRSWREGFVDGLVEAQAGAPLPNRTLARVEGDGCDQALPDRVPGR